MHKLISQVVCFAMGTSTNGILMDTSQANLLLQNVAMNEIFELKRLADLEPGADIEWLLNQFVNVIIFYPIMKCP